MSGVRQFYDDWAEEYHLIFADWKQSIAYQGEALSRLIRVEAPSAQSILDCTCGIGTQSIGLAQKGFRVTATDLSANAVARALREAPSFGVSLAGWAADLRSLDETTNAQFDVVLTCDNSLCHLLEDEDLALATRQIAKRVRPGGLFLASIRDYDGMKQVGQVTSQQLPGELKLPEGPPRATIPRVIDDSAGRRIVFQVWDWAPDGKSYGVNQYCVTDASGTWKTSHRASRFRALLRAELTGFLEGAGLRDILWRMPEETGYYQPIVTARAGGTR